MYAELTTKKSKQAFIREMVGTDQRWAVRALVRIYNNQTEDEQAAEMTNHHNGIGFTGADAEILSSFAKQVLKGRQLSAKQMAILFRKMPRYARQLMEAADTKG